MAKQAKMTQTDYTRGGRDISNTATPLYQSNLTRMDNYLEDPMAYQDKYLNKYFTDTPTQNDFLRNYTRTMGNATANNYAATNGGYASLNQMNYDDLQRNKNDEFARLYNQGVTSAYDMAGQDFINMLNANNSYNAAYQLGKAYSDVEQYNDMVDQVNSNWWAPAVSTLGAGLSAVGLPAIGVPLTMAGNIFTVDAPQIGSLRSINSDGSLGMGSAINNSASKGLYNLFNTLGGNDKFNWLVNPNTPMNNNKSNPQTGANTGTMTSTERGRYNWFTNP